MVLGSFYYYDYILGAHKAAVSHALSLRQMYRLSLGRSGGCIGRHVSQALPTV